VRGFALSSPFIAMKLRVPAWKRGLARVLSSVTPGFGLPTGLDPDLLSRDPEVGRRYMADPLVLKAATTRWFTETMGAQSAALSKAGSVAIPGLVMHGTADGIADPEGSKQLFERLGGQDKELKLWPDLRHEPFNEPEGATVIGHVVSWIDARLPRA
jgi:alpha-beta hydrolase superfamily lysophospholipase